MKIAMGESPNLVILADCFRRNEDTVFRRNELVRKYGEDLDLVRRRLGEHHPILHLCTYNNGGNYDELAYLAVISKNQEVAHTALEYYIHELNLKRFEWESSPLEKEIKTTLVCLAIRRCTIPYCFSPA